MPVISPKVTVVIPNWNGMRHLPECLGSLSTQSFRDFRTVIVDNSSTDEGIAWVRKQYPEISVIQLEENGGFAKAVNTGILASESEYIALLNNDTAVGPEWLRALVDALDRRPQYDFAASKMVFYSDPERLNGAGDVWSHRDLTAVNRGYGEPASRYDQTGRVFGACAGAAMYRRTLFEQVGLFDEGFFLMHEDTDLNLRCLLAGKRCLFVPGAQVRHKLGASISTRPALQMVRLQMRNETLAAVKNLPLGMLFFRPATWPYRLVRHAIAVRPPKLSRFPLLLLRLTPPSLGAEIEGIRRGLGRRRQAQKLRVVSPREIRYWLRHGYGPA